jgi:hypothetical protein
MNLYNIKNTWKEAKERGWNRTYWFVDFHNTIAVADYGDPEKKRQFFPYAKEVLHFLTKQDDVCLVLWTCSHRDDINEMIEFLEENDIKFDYINENPECVSDKRVNLTQKPYYNVMLDDRAGFDPEDWEIIGAFLEDHYDANILLEETKISEHPGIIKE